MLDSLSFSLQASFQNNKYQLWVSNYVFELYFLIEVGVTLEIYAMHLNHTCH